ncbi:carboxymuconolactone decarboxylase family protein [Amycolatopsis sp. EV170708-02-1]|uniref:carboxymuconolactone decarboxylase family protein n=1 Tax=Amycolatopsis sp. EV170708-02-1 TaxID=2919322 RepID=UPI001F0BD7D3|nr:carboxymuconolactone decarboxylase family protein [Amycolatopsis sp. EV170708-02-1]UMP00003.1 carboxymuconolactone decarboxylase family protein [Amycolatopsis sp. EV170708-02-1]
MAMIAPLHEDEVTPEVAHVFARVEQEYGFVPNILRTMAHCPDLLTTFVPLWAQIYQSPTIGARLRALAALGTAKAQECTYCVAHMTASARKAGFGEEQILAVGDLSVINTAFNDRESLILETADALTRDPDGVSDELRRRLADEFTESEIVNIVLAIGMYNLTSRFLKALSVDVENVFTEANSAAG